MHPVTQLLDSIRADRDMILYFENRILKKEIAIEEILNAASCSEELTIAAMVEKTLELDINGANFSPKQLEELAVKRFPDDEERLERRVGQVCYALAGEGKIVLVSRGVYRKRFAPEGKVCETLQ